MRRSARIDTWHLRCSRRCDYGNGVMSLFENKEWYVIYSKPRREEYAQFQLRTKGLEVFFPRLLLPSSLSVRKPIVPLFPNYLFVRARIPEEYELVAWSPGVKRFVSFNDVPVSIDESIVTFLMRQANPAGVITARSNFQAGQEVRINGGPFDGLAGIIQAPPDGRGRVKVLMELLSRRIPVEVPLQFVKGAGLSYRPAISDEPLN
ncbi:MAG TPA: transcription termination/antitermination NusG family protein [Candidatus Eisenbacteria bacterium]|nr:transcription termination/antitermination NusG family protein [Candidatus Eisenbacteria bacterium]